MQGVQEWTIKAERVKSLCWQGDRLIDWVAGGNIYELDGTVKPRHVAYSYRFDAAVISPSGTYAVIYEKLGTKGLVLKNGNILREINRSFYYANAYEYPVVLFQLPSGQEVIAHCPEKFFQIEIDDLESGKRLSKEHVPQRSGIFQSRLRVNEAGTILLSAGWVWQPSDSVRIYDIRATLNDERYDGEFVAEVSAAAFLEDNQLIIGGTDEAYDEEEDIGIFVPVALSLYDISQKQNRSLVKPDAVVGTIMPLSSRLIVGFYEHPKLIDLNTGNVLYQWSELNSGEQRSSILWTTPPIPPLALDPTHARFAVADETAIHIVQIDPTSFSQ